MSLKRNIKVAYVSFLDGNKNVMANKMFFSTHIDMPAEIIVKYYKARFQIEYLYRDSKQFAGLEHGQSRSKCKLDFHFNASLTAVSISKAILRSENAKTKQVSLSISDIKTELRYRNMIIRIFSMYGFEPKLLKNTPDNAIGYKIYRKLLNFGKIAA